MLVSGMAAKAAPAIVRGLSLLLARTSNESVIQVSPDSLRRCRGGEAGRLGEHLSRVGHARVYSAVKTGESPPVGCPHAPAAHACGGRKE